MAPSLVDETMDNVFQLLSFNELNGCETYHNFHRSPADLTDIERQEALLLAKVCAESHAYFDEFNCSLPRQLRYERKPAGMSGLLDVPFTPLPLEFDTPQRRIHVALHMIILDGAPYSIALRQFAISERLRSAGEFDVIIEVITILNAVSQHITGKVRFLMDPEYSSSIDLKIAQLMELRSRRPSLHYDIVQCLLFAARDEGTPHPLSCACILCLYLEDVEERIKHGLL